VLGRETTGTAIPTCLTSGLHIFSSSSARGLGTSTSLAQIAPWSGNLAQLPVGRWLQMCSDPQARGGWLGVVHRWLTRFQVSTFTAQPLSGSSGPNNQTSGSSTQLGSNNP
jgi:hypothetical protein